MKGVFSLLLDCAEGDRPARLAALCGDDDALRSEVESLLGHVDRPAIDMTAAARAMNAAAHERSLRLLGREREGEVMIAEAVERIEAALGPDAPVTRTARDALAAIRAPHNLGGS